MMNNSFNPFIQSQQTLAITVDQQQISFAAFWQDVSQQAQLILLRPESTFALWQQDSYEFLVLLFAALQAKKRIVLPPHRVAQLEQNLASQHIYFLSRQTFTDVNSNFVLDLSQNFLEQAQIDFYTSGSTGEPKRIERTLAQLFKEVQGLDQTFCLTEQVLALATVSHQHIYGLLFKLLWPLASGRSFYQKQLAFPEDVVDLQKKIAHVQLPNYVISSPALLKRWTTDVVLQDCHRVYSSGGKLDAGVRPLLNRPITEVFGSSETGGIAHRQADDALWTPFANVAIQCAEQQELAVKTNHAFSTDWILTGDKVQVADVQNPKSPFQLLGRLDRIVKLEEKRLSLDAIEAKLAELAEIQQCHVLIHEKEQRQILAVVAVLTEDARVLLIEKGKAAFTAQLKKQLQQKLESIAIPRQWRFLTQMPQNAQSKLNQQYLKSLFQPMSLPVVLTQQSQDAQISYALEFIPELECFKGHFPNFPIYPGVGQIGFIQHFAKQNWADLLWCNGFEQLKFQGLIQHYQTVELVLSRKAHKVSFELKNHDKILASGRLLFAVPSDV